MALPDPPADGLGCFTTTVQPDWLDYNEHMNVSYYVRTFDLAVDAFKDVIGLTGDRIDTSRRSTVALEAHITYQREASLGDELTVKTRVIDFDGKRAHLYQEMYRGEDLLATQELMAISFDLESRRSCPFDADIAERYEKMLALQSRLPKLDGLGRKVGIRRK